MKTLTKNDIDAIWCPALLYHQGRYFLSDRIRIKCANILAKEHIFLDRLNTIHVISSYDCFAFLIVGETAQSFINSIWENNRAT
jgi:hypothetical protein